MRKFRGKIMKKAAKAKRDPDMLAEYDFSQKACGASTPSDTPRARTSSCFRPMLRNTFPTPRQ